VTYKIYSSQAIGGGAAYAHKSIEVFVKVLLMTHLPYANRHCLGVSHTW